MNRLQRRDFLIAIAAILGAPRAVDAQSTPAKLGILAPTSTRLPQYSALWESLRMLGYQVGVNLLVSEHSAEGRAERLPELAVALVRNNVDVILAPGPEDTLRAARRATSTVPIVMVAIDYDPLTLGYIASLGKPGGNVTGVSLQQLDLTAKRLGLLKESFPGVSKVSVLWDRFSADQWRVVQAAAQSMGVQVQSFELREPPYDYARTFHAASRQGFRACLVLLSPVFFRDRVQLVEMAARNDLATMFGLREWTESGGLMSYGANVSDMYILAATYIDKILKGADPAQLPVAQSSKFELVVNRRTAETLRLTIPPSILIRADHVIK